MRRRSTDLLNEFVPGDTEHVGEVDSPSGCRSDLADSQHHTIRMCAVLANVLDFLRSQLACCQHATLITIDQDEDADVEAERPDRREDRRWARVGSDHANLDLHLTAIMRDEIVGLLGVRGKQAVVHDGGAVLGEVPDGGIISAHQSPKPQFCQDAGVALE